MTDEALAEIEKAAALEKDDPVIHDHLGDIYYKKGMSERAKAEWKKSLELDPGQETVREKLGK